jgi:alpha-tubulin suppressor-like RCC1 family protein
MGRRLVVFSTAALAGIAAPLTVGAAPPNTYEWGRPVASGGPGLVPTIVQTAAAVQIDAGNYGDVLVKSDGSVWAWGSDLSTSTMTLAQVPGVRNVVQRPVDGNGSFAAIEQPGVDLACPASSTVIGWSRTKAPAVVTALNCLKVVQLAKAAAHTFALTASGAVYAWGGGAVLGLGSTVTSEKNPTLVPAVTALTGGTATGVELTTGMNFAGILVNGFAWSWGDNTYGQCGCSSTTNPIYTPTRVDQGAIRFASIDDGGNLTSDGHELALTASGTVYAWGDNAAGQLGLGDTVNRSAPVLVPGLPTIVDVRAGGMHSLALDSGGNVFAWGGNHYGQVGDGSTHNALAPVEVLRGVTAISAGSYHSIAM